MYQFGLILVTAVFSTLTLVHAEPLVDPLTLPRFTRGSPNYKGYPVCLTTDECCVLIFEDLLEAERRLHNFVFIDSGYAKLDEAEPKIVHFLCKDLRPRGADVNPREPTTRGPYVLICPDWTDAILYKEAPAKGQQLSPSGSTTKGRCLLKGSRLKATEIFAGSMTCTATAVEHKGGIMKAWLSRDKNTLTPLPTDSNVRGPFGSDYKLSLANVNTGVLAFMETGIYEVELSVAKVGEVYRACAQVPAGHPSAYLHLEMLPSGHL